MSNVDERIGACGLFCGACVVWRRCHDEQDFFTGGPDARPGEGSCKGCLSEHRSRGCMACDIRKCAADKENRTCAECSEMPCDRLLAFRKRLPHLKIIVEQLQDLSSLGESAWLQAQRARWSCAECGAPHDWYASQCGRCGGEVHGFEKEEAGLE